MKDIFIIIIIKLYHKPAYLNTKIKSKKAKQNLLYHIMAYSNKTTKQTNELRKKTVKSALAENKPVILEKI